MLSFFPFSFKKFFFQTKRFNYENRATIRAHVPLMGNSAQERLWPFPFAEVSMGYFSNERITVYHLVKKHSHEHYKNRVQVDGLTLFSNQ